MSNNHSESRRDFIKKSAAGATGLIAAHSGLGDVFSQPASVADRGYEINPKINNLRVVYVEDPAMLQDGTSTVFDKFSTATTKVKADKVKENMDKMACALANTGDAGKAWETIFQKPANKNWSDVLIAIKPNCAAGGSDGQKYPHASVAIINAVCNVLIGFGAKGSNMTIYDTNGFSTSPASLYPAGLMVEGIKFLGPSSRYYPAPVGSTVSQAALEADIIVNIASCKGHSALGGTTLTLKNHLGTVGGHVTDVKKILDIHNSAAVLGKPVVGQVPPKQQVAIVDCLWTARSGPTAAPDKTPCMIVMGTSCPAVDCFTAIKLRLEKFGYSGTRATFIQYLTLYGYDAATDVEPLLKTPTPPPDPQGRGWIDAMTWVPTGIHGIQSPAAKNDVVTFSVIGSAFRPVQQAVSLPAHEEIQSVSIVDVKGKTIRTLAVDNSGGRTVFWDGRNRQGRFVGAGTYFITVKGAESRRTVQFTLRKQ